MISKNYTIGYLQSNGKRSKPKLVFGNKPQDIEGYTEAINSEELYVVHHRLEKDYTKKELEKMGRYYIVPAEELIWMKSSIHNNNPNIHKGYRFLENQNLYVKYVRRIEKLRKIREFKKRNAEEKLRNKEIAKFEKLLKKQQKLKKVGGKRWCYYEQKLQEIIEVL